MKSVNRLEFDNFIISYPNKLEKDVCGISDPPCVTFNDFTLGEFPQSIVAKTFLWSDNPNDRYYEKEENRTYYIKS